MVRPEHGVAAAVAPVGAGLAKVHDRPLPEVQDTARGGPGRVVDQERAIGEAGEVDDVRRRQIRGDDAPLLPQRVVDDEVAEPRGAEDLGRALTPGQEPDQRQGPQIRLGGALRVQLVEQQLG
nr:hypothetical protein [Streptomyces kasugaensis]